MNIKQLLYACHKINIIKPAFKRIMASIFTYTGFYSGKLNLYAALVNIGANAFIAPGACIACSGHSLDAEQRAQGIGYSKPINIGDDVRIGANSTICGGVSVGTGSVVIKDIPTGNLCRIIRPATEKDKIQPVKVDRNLCRCYRILFKYR